MILVLNIAILVTLFFIVFQDFKERQIWWFLPLILIVLLALSILPTIPFKNYFYSLLYVVLIVFVLSVYVRIRFKSSALFKEYFGLGDLLTLIAFIPFFHFREYVFFTTTATCLALVFFLMMQLIKKAKTIPYAGYVSLVFGCYFVYFQLTGLRLLNYD